MNRPLDNLAQHEALKLILEGTSRATGREFFRALVRTLAAALGTHGAWVTELDPAGWTPSPSGSAASGSRTTATPSPAPRARA